MSEANVLVINCGSSSLKFAVVEPETGTTLRHGIAERLGTEGARLRIAGQPDRALPQSAAAPEVLDLVLPALSGLPLVAVGHRVVHGGEAFADSVILDATAIDAIRACIELAPLHNPANLSAIESARARFPSLPHVAVFDTAFHQTLPPKAFLYAIPYELYRQHKVRRYGFHGSSHRYVAGEAAKRLGRPLESLQLVTAHLGNGCSTCAIKDGRSVDTSMGLTPLEGLVMGTRSGDVDPNLHQFLAERTGQTLDEITDSLNRKSGLLGLSGRSNDMRTLLAAESDPRARLAVEVFCYRLAKSVLALCAALERLDALVFTGGIGEHAAQVRADTLAGLRLLGAEVDPEANATNGTTTDGRITSRKSSLLGLVIASNEELVIAREAARLLAPG
ncbi:MAG TPA: acetate kinase [Polyangiaceae bacterium]